MNKKSILEFGLLAALAATVLLTSGCTKTETTDSIKVGVTAGPHAAIVTEAAKVAKTRGLNVRVIEFTDYITPNKALSEKELDANVYQHAPFLNNFNKNNGTDLKVVAKGVVQPMGFYSRNIRSLDAIPEGARIAIPNDPTNGGRALLLVQASGLITLKDGGTHTATIKDIAANPKNIQFVELEAAQLPRSLDDVAISVIPMNYVISAGLSAKKDGFYFESREAPFALMIIAARPDNEENPAIKTFIESYQSEPVREFIAKTFDGAVQPAW